MAASGTWAYLLRYCDRMAHGHSSPSGLAANDQSLAPGPIPALAPEPGAPLNGNRHCAPPTAFFDLPG